MYFFFNLQGLFHFLNGSKIASERNILNICAIYSDVTQYKEVWYCDPDKNNKDNNNGDKDEKIVVIMKL